MESGEFLTRFFNGFWEANAKVHLTPRNTILGQISNDTSSRIRPNLLELEQILKDLELVQKVRNYIALDQDYLIGFEFDSVENNIKFRDSIKAFFKSKYVIIDDTVAKTATIFVNAFPLCYNRELLQNKLRNYGKIVVFDYIQDYKFSWRLSSNNIKIRLLLNQNVDLNDIPCIIEIDSYPFVLMVAGLPPVCYHCRIRQHRAKDCKEKFLRRNIHINAKERVNGLDVLVVEQASDDNLDIKSQSQVEHFSTLENSSSQSRDVANEKSFIKKKANSIQKMKRNKKKHNSANKNTRKKFHCNERVVVVKSWGSEVDTSEPEVETECRKEELKLKVGGGSEISDISTDSGYSKSSSINQDLSDLGHSDPYKIQEILNEYAGHDLYTLKESMLKKVIQDIITYDKADEWDFSALVLYCLDNDGFLEELSEAFEARTKKKCTS